MPPDRDAEARLSLRARSPDDTLQCQIERGDLRVLRNALKTLWTHLPENAR
jgi:hypothetical protein